MLLYCFILTKLLSDDTGWILKTFKYSDLVKKKPIKIHGLEGTYKGSTLLIQTIDVQKTQTEA